MENEYKDCIRACQQCSVICHSCAVSCLFEHEVTMLTTCVLLDIECAAVCNAAVQVMGLNGETARQLCRVCAAICERCAAECEKHSHMQHCKDCGQACRDCASECNKMAAAA